MPHAARIEERRSETHDLGLPCRQLHALLASISSCFVTARTPHAFPHEALGSQGSAYRPRLPSPSSMAFPLCLRAETNCGRLSFMISGPIKGFFLGSGLA